MRGHEIERGDARWSKVSLRWLNKRKYEEKRRALEIERRLPLVRVMYQSHGWQREQLELQRMRLELQQLQAEILGKLADARYDAAQAEETEIDADRQQKQGDYYSKALNSITNYV